MDTQQTVGKYVVGVKAWHFVRDYGFHALVVVLAHNCLVYTEQFMGDFSHVHAELILIIVMISIFWFVEPFTSFTLYFVAWYMGL
jgi:hypothetical protein